MRHPPVLPAIAALVLAAALAGLPAAPALAHARLIASQPAAGVTVDVAPEEVVLEFNEAVEADFGQLQVSGPDGTRLDQEAPTSSGAFVRAPIGPATAAGTHTVAYRMVSADGHPVEGSFTYEVPDSAVAAAAPQPTATPEPEPTATPGPEPTASPSPEPAPTAAPAPNATRTPEPIDAAETSAEGDGGGLPVVALLIAALLVLGVGGALLARRGGEPDPTGGEPDRS